MTDQPRDAAIAAQPQTAAGRALMRSIEGDDGLIGTTRFVESARAYVLAIEREAAALPPTATPEPLDVALATIEAMQGDAADLHDLIGEAAAMRTVLGHLLAPTGRIHDSGCGTCDAGRALLTADHELPSAALRESQPEGVYVTAEEWDARCRCGDLTVCEIVEARRP